VLDSLSREARVASFPCKDMHFPKAFKSNTSSFAYAFLVKVGFVMGK